MLLHCSRTEFDPTASDDNCAVATLTNDFNGLTTLAGAEIPSGTTVVWTATDGAGNTGTCSFTVTVLDTQDPTVTCIADPTRNADAGECFYTVVGTEFDPTASDDNCAVATVTNDFNGLTTLAGAEIPSGTTVVWTATDGAGNTGTCSFTVTVLDTQDPTVTCIADPTRNADAGECFYTVVGTEFDPTASDDNCAVATVTNDFNGLTTLAGAEIPSGTTVVWTATDGAGNTGTCSFTVTVLDTQDPTVTCIADPTRNADAGECFYTVVGTEFDPTEVQITVQYDYYQ